MYRYRKTTGVSRDVLQKFKSHCHRLGIIQRIVGYRFLSISKKNDCSIEKEALMIYGSDGTMRLDGCCWSYKGEGPRATVAVLVEAGIDQSTAEKFAFDTDRDFVGVSELAKMSGRRSIDWEIFIEKENLCTTQN